jgi:hypothetical protein
LIKQQLLNRKRTKEIAKDMSQYRRSLTAAEKAGENQLILNEKKAWFDAKGRAELRYDKEFNEYCVKLKEEQKELKSVVNGQILYQDFQG